MSTAANTGQLSLDLRRRTWGGAREGAGRKRSQGRHDASHRSRPAHRKYHPVHIVLRTLPAVGRLRRGAVFRALHRALAKISSRLAFRVVHISIQHSHLHLLVEADDKLALSRGMHAFAIIAARAINRSLHRTGKVFAFRYHATEVTTPRQTRHALAYTLMNWRRHREDLRSERASRALVDPYSSGPTFAGWRGGPFRTLPPATIRFRSHSPRPGCSPPAGSAMAADSIRAPSPARSADSMTPPSNM